MTAKGDLESEDGFFLLAKTIYSLISDKRYDEARSLIDTEGERFPEDDAHRVKALSAVLHKSIGDIDRGIALMHEALRAKPNWLPHLYRLSVMLMDAKRWDDADVVLGELIALSLEKGDAYFLDDSRFRKAICLNILGRADELKQVKAEIPAGTTAFIGDKLCRIEDM